MAETTDVFGAGSGSIWLSEVMCTGEEESISRCQSSRSISEVCTHALDAGVTCQPGNS